MHNVGSDFSQHRAVVGEPPPNPVPLGGALGGGWRPIADRQNLDVRQRQKTHQVLAGDLSCANQRCLHLRCPRGASRRALASDLRSLSPTCRSAGAFLMLNDSAQEEW